jgi:hypothetical protein
VGADDVADQREGLVAQHDAAGLGDRLQARGEVRLGARLQSVAEAGRIVLSYETYALVRHLVTARALPPITMKGISREVVPYAVERLIDAEAIDVHVVAEETAGLSLYLDPGAIQAGDVEKVKSTLSRALAAMEQVQVKPA